MHGKRSRQISEAKGRRPTKKNPPRFFPHPPCFVCISTLWLPRVVVVVVFFPCGIERRKKKTNQKNKQTREESPVLENRAQCELNALAANCKSKQPARGGQPKTKFGAYPIFRAKKKRTMQSLPRGTAQPVNQNQRFAHHPSRPSPRPEPRATTSTTQRRGSFFNKKKRRRKKGQNIKRKTKQDRRCAARRSPVPPVLPCPVLSCPVLSVALTFFFFTPRPKQPATSHPKSPRGRRGCRSSAAGSGDSLPPTGRFFAASASVCFRACAGAKKKRT